MSNAEYVAKLDEDQLSNLIEHATARREKIRQAGWVKLWVVTVNWANVAWFELDDYEAAVARACEEVKNEAVRSGARKPVEMELRMDRFRPDELADLLAPRRAAAHQASAPTGDSAGRAESGME